VIDWLAARVAWSGESVIRSSAPSTMIVASSPESVVLTCSWVFGSV
jgi:hypothetical protein